MREMKTTCSICGAIIHSQHINPGIAKRGSLKGRLITTVRLYCLKCGWHGEYPPGVSVREAYQSYIKTSELINGD